MLNGGTCGEWHCRRDTDDVGSKSSGQKNLSMQSSLDSLEFINNLYFRV
jgi:hypothetical protein